MNIKAKTKYGIRTIPSDECIQVSGAWIERIYFESEYMRCDECEAVDQKVDNHGTFRYESHEIIPCCKLNFYKFANGGATICEECFALKYKHCEGCSCILEKKDVLHDNEKRSFCANCFNPVQRWNYRPHRFNFIGNDPDNLFLGVELEVDTADRATMMEISTNLHEFIRGRGYVMRDASINNLPRDQQNRPDGESGFEIVSHPMSLPEQANLWYEVFENFGTQLTVPDTCGLHVHVSREPISQLHTVKLCKFIHYNTNRKFIHFVAGRPGNDYCQYYSKRDWDRALNYEEYQKKEAINLVNPQTFEFRMFAATLDFPMFLSRIEFTRATMDYIRHTRRDTPTARGFREWLADDSKNKSYEYTNLMSHINDNWSL